MDNPYRQSSRSTSRPKTSKKDPEMLYSFTPGSDIEHNKSTYRDDITMSPLRNMTTCEEMSKDFQKQWEEEYPRSNPRSPEQNDTLHEVEQDQLTYLLDTVLSAQDKYLKLFPNMKHRITENDTRSFEDITFCMLQQGLFLYEECK